LWREEGGLRPDEMLSVGDFCLAQAISPDSCGGIGVMPPVIPDIAMMVA
jgi:hypothetical protein